MKAKISNLAARILAKAWYDDQQVDLTPEDETEHEDFAWSFVEESPIGTLFELDGPVIMEKCQDGIYLRDTTEDERETARMTDEACGILRGLYA